MDDLISRQAAIDALRDWEMCYDWDEHCREEPKEPWVVSPSDVVNKLPTIQPKRGWWIEIINSRGVVVALRCSRCEKSPRHGVRSDFCPNCGADMEVTT